MEAKRYDEAIWHVPTGHGEPTTSIGKLQIISKMKPSSTPRMMAWLARNDVKEAIPLLDKIKADKTHLYHDVVVRMSSLDLRIAAYKDLK